MDHNLARPVCITSLLQPPSRNQAAKMTMVSIIASSVESPVTVRAELLDALVEAVVLSADPRTRSAIIRSLVHEMCAAVRWLHGGDTTSDDAADVELASISQLAAAAQDHHWRMGLLGPGAAGSDLP
jgi:hypothetical protein